MGEIKVRLFRKLAPCYILEQGEPVSLVLAIIAGVAV